MTDAFDNPGHDSPALYYGLTEDELHDVYTPTNRLYDPYDAPPADYVDYPPSALESGYVDPPQHPVKFVPSPAGILARDQDRQDREYVCVFAGLSLGIGIMLAGNALTYISAGQWPESGIAFVGAAISVILGCLTWGVGEKKVPR